VQTFQKGTLSRPLGFRVYAGKVSPSGLFAQNATTDHELPWAYQRQVLHEQQQQRQKQDEKAGVRVQHLAWRWRTSLDCWMPRSPSLAVHLQPGTFARARAHKPSARTHTLESPILSRCLSLGRRSRASSLSPALSVSVSLSLFVFLCLSLYLCLSLSVSHSLTHYSKSIGANQHSAHPIHRIKAGLIFNLASLFER
jgi:hypothetical protein